ncbi:MAG: glutaredoxin [Burkholderiaceae bacterium]|nr:glutaredoxin [Burkholderiaceae bacterium]
MATKEHLCPFGLRSLDLLRREGFTVDDRLLATRAEVDAFKAKEGVETTPQTFIGSQRIGGWDELRRHLGRPVSEASSTSYTPVIAVFGLAAALAMAAAWAARDAVPATRALEWFVAIAMCLLALLKLRDLEGFANGFLGYDLLARRVVRYAWVYPFAEALAGVLMVAGALPWLSVPVALFIGTIGAASVIKAVYVERRELHCACVGGGSRVPLGAVSLIENLMMVAMALWMGWRAWG